jgi:hypothetical protein
LYSCSSNILFRQEDFQDANRLWGLLQYLQSLSFSFLGRGVTGGDTQSFGQRMTLQHSSTIFFPRSQDYFAIVELATGRQSAELFVVACCPPVVYCRWHHSTRKIVSKVFRRRSESYCFIFILRCWSLSAKSLYIYSFTLMLKLRVKKKKTP